MADHLSEAPSLKVDWSWKKFRGLISDNTTEKQTMIVKCNIKKPYLEFISMPDETRVGTGNIHTFKIDCEAEVQGKPIDIKASKRWTTGYTHLSDAFAKSPGNPMVMTWTTKTSFKNWDFICLDENQEPVARFSSNIWAVRKIGNIEFVGDKANDPVAREEITITGLTIFYCMLARANNIFAFFGAIFAKPGPIKQGDNGVHELEERSDSFEPDAKIPSAKALEVAGHAHQA